MSDDVLQRAKDFATEAHKGQKYGDSPYTYHLVQVTNVLSRFGFEQEHLHAAAWLHDVVEDTEATLQDVKTIGGSKVEEIVARVTDQPGKNRRERKAKTYPQIAECVDATIIKLADRVANVENCIQKGNRGLLSMYIQEHAFFRDTLYQEDSEAQPLWEHLDNLIDRVTA
jgi:(p)ppGpp synthase/HD superfamily hydrolase